jgi:hypothetical protein
MNVMPFLILSLFLATDSMAAKKNWNFSVIASVTRCFEAKEIRVHCEDFSDSERSTPTEELQIEAKDFKGGRYAYIYGKAIQGPLCQQHLKRIKRLLKHADQACVTGEDEIKIDTGEIVLRWRGFETRFGELNW